MRIVPVYGLLAFLTLLVGCDNSFTPKENFVERIAVFSVLDPSYETQVVRLARSYDAEPGSPLVPLTDAQVLEAEVRVREGGKTYLFRDSTIDCGNGCSEKIWVSSEFQPMHNSEYKLSVRIPGYDEATSDAMAPDRLFIFLESVRSDTGVGMLRVRPGSSFPNNPPAGYYFRLWVSVQKRENGIVTEYRREVPVGHDAETGAYQYTKPSRENEQKFTKYAVTSTHDAMVSDGEDIVEEELIVHGYAMDRQFYNYYKIVRGFDDPLSIRLDHPDISYIDGGLGVFGINMPDSARYPYERYTD